MKFIELIGLIELMVNRSQVIESVDRAVFPIRNPQSLRGVGAYGPLRYLSGE